MGRHFAQKLAARGARLALSDVNEQGLRDTIQSLAPGTEARSYVVDISQSGDVDRFRLDVERDFGTVNVLINNAGIVHGGPFLEVPRESHIRTYRVNVEGVVMVTHAFLPHLIRSKDAHMIHMASATGLVGVPMASTYASSKWAVIGFAESLRQELDELGVRHVRSTIVCPSTVDTGMFRGTKPPLLMPMLDPERLVEKILRSAERRKVYLLEPFFIKLVPLMKGVFPLRLMDFTLVRLKVRSAMRSWQGRKPLPLPPSSRSEIQPHQ
jgi:short-subunit dehydrogenase